MYALLHSQFTQYCVWVVMGINQSLLCAQQFEYWTHWYGQLGI